LSNFNGNLRGVVVIEDFWTCYSTQDAFVKNIFGMVNNIHLIFITITERRKTAEQILLWDQCCPTQNKGIACVLFEVGLICSALPLLTVYMKIDLFSVLTKLEKPSTVHLILLAM